MFFPIENRLFMSRIRESYYFYSLFKKDFLYTYCDRLENEISIRDTNFYNICFFLKYHFFFQYDQLIDIAVVDYPQKNYRFKITYHLLSITYSRRLRLSFSLQELIPIPTLVSIYPSADWLEREVWDFFGIFFQKHPDLRRILTDYGFKGYPLRKDFPLTGFLEVFYDDTLKQIVYRPVSLNQEFRNYVFFNTWAPDSIH